MTAYMQLVGQAMGVDCVCSISYDNRLSRLCWCLLVIASCSPNHLDAAVWWGSSPAVVCFVLLATHVLMCVVPDFVVPLPSGQENGLDTPSKPSNTMSAGGETWVEVCMGRPC